jgi:hypothetical protein
MTKQHFFSFIVALFATVFSAVGQSSPNHITQGGKGFIIDDYILGLVKDFNCHRTGMVSLPRANGTVYLISAKNAKLAETIFITATFEEFWRIKVQYDTKYVDNPLFSFLSKSVQLIKPEIDDQLTLSLTGIDGTILDALIFKNFDEEGMCIPVKINPNPATDYIDVSMDLDIALVANITVYDNFGNISQQISDISLAAGRNTQRIDLSAARAGLYRVVVEAGDRRQIIPVQKN